MFGNAIGKIRLYFKFVDFMRTGRILGNASEDKNVIVIWDTRLGSQMAGETEWGETEKRLCSETWDEKIWLLVRQIQTRIQVPVLSRTWDEKSLHLMKQRESRKRWPSVRKRETGESDCQGEDMKPEWDDSLWRDVRWESAIVEKTPRDEDKEKNTWHQTCFSWHFSRYS